MPLVTYENWSPNPQTASVVRQANAICEEYGSQGYDLTLRQLYYQFVARGLIPNQQKEYNRLGRIVSKARMAGLLDWSYIVDRTRNSRRVIPYEDVPDFIRSMSRYWHLDWWEGQPTRVECWIEKEALAGVIEGVCARWDLTWFSCRGYVSQSEQWRAGQRHLSNIERGLKTVVLHLGDHDPSGIDMTRDIGSRLRTFVCQGFYNSGRSSSTSYGDIWEDMSKLCGERIPLEVRRIALNMDQVEEYQPPPNPAKMTDSRVGNYIYMYGEESWELDALDPATLETLIEDEVRSEIYDWDLWEERRSEEEKGDLLMQRLSDQWDTVSSDLSEGTSE